MKLLRAVGNVLLVLFARWVSSWIALFVSIVRVVSFGFLWPDWSTDYDTWAIKFLVERTLVRTALSLDEEASQSR